jgi:hypothetical protein
MGVLLALLFVAVRLFNTALQTENMRAAIVSTK